MSTHGRAVWRTATVVEAVDVTPTARRLTLHRPGAGRAAPGAHVDVRVPIEGREDNRSYSVVSSAPEDRLTITVLRVRDSRGGSAYLHGVEVGQELSLTQPLQNFSLRVGAPRYLLVAGGIGITALVDAARVLASLGADYRLVYVGRSRESMAYLAELEEQHGDRLEVHVDAEGTALDPERLVADLADGEHARATELYMCGPIRLMDGLRRAWETHALPPTNLRYETFGNSGWFDPEPFTVRIPELGIETLVGTETTMLEALTYAGADLLYDCRKGECGLCRMDVADVEGSVDHRDVFFSRSQQEAGAQLCTCVSRVASTTGPGRPAVTLRLP